jgi:AcrR family transcriptional regulator
MPQQNLLTLDVAADSTKRMSRNKAKSPTTLSNTPEKLLAVAIDLFSKKGFKGTSIRDIASNLGMTTSNIYHFFGTKEGILTAIERQTLEPIVCEFRRIEGLDLPPLDRFTLLIRTHLSYLDAHRKENKILSLSDETLLSSGKDGLTRKFHRETFSIYRSEIERLLSAEGITGNATLTAFNTLGTVIWFLRWYRQGGPNSLEEATDNIVSYVLHGILGGDSSIRGRHKT